MELIPFKILEKFSDESLLQIKTNCDLLKEYNQDLINHNGLYHIPFRSNHKKLSDNIINVLRKEIGLTLIPYTMTLFMTKPLGGYDEFHVDLGLNGKLPVKKSAINILLTRRDNQGFLYKGHKDDEGYYEYNMEKPIIFSPSELWHNFYNNNNEWRELLSIRFLEDYDTLIKSSHI